MKPQGAGKPLPKNSEEHLHFLEDLSRLKLYVAAWYKTEHCEETVGAILEQRTFILTLTDLHQGSIYGAPVLKDSAAWEAIRNGCEGLCDKLVQQLPDGPMDRRLQACLSNRFEEEAFRRFFKGLHEDRVEKDLHELHDPKRSFTGWPSCIWYRDELVAAQAFPIWGPGIKEENAPKALKLHIVNNRYPESFLRDPNYLRSCLHAAARDARDRLGYRHIGTVTWLNEHPAWLRVLPPSWTRNLSAPDAEVGAHLGCWGQVIDARQTLHAKIAALVRETGHLPYRMRGSYCPVEDLL